MASFVINTKAEILKCRKTAAYWLTLLAGMFVPLVSGIMLVGKQDHFIKRLGDDTWRNYMTMNWQPAAAFFLPMYVILVTSLVVQVEYRNNAWKQVYASPRSYADVFFSKFLVVHMLVLGSLFFFNLSMVLTASVANLVNGGYKFFRTALPLKEMFMVTGKMYVAVLAMTAIQYWISMRLKNYVAPVGIGLALLVTALMIMSWERIAIFPYAYTALTYFAELNKGNMSHQYYSFVWFVVVVLLGFLDTVKRKERG